MTTSGIRVELRGVGDLSLLGETWRALEADAETSWFQSWSWIGCWLAELEPRVRPDLLVATDDGRIVGLALICRRRNTRRRVIVFRGCYLHETGDPRLDVLTVEYNGFLVRREGSEAIVHEFLRYLGDHVRDCDEFYLSGVGAHYEKLVARAGLGVWCRGRSPCPQFSLDELRAGGRDLFSLLSSNTRAQLRRAMRLYEERGPLTIESAPDLDTALAYWAALEELHQSYWTSRGEPGAFSNPFFEAMHRRLIEASLERGEVDLLRCSAGGSPIGYLYNFVHRGHVYSYQSGFHYEPDNRLKVGLVSHALAIQRYAAEGHSIYDFMAGDSQYKRSLASRQSELVWLVLQRPLLRFRVEHVLRRLRARLSRS